jgi:hypothetical protein
MSNPISAVAPAQPVQNATPAPAAKQKASETKSPPTTADTVTISTSAKAILQEVQENHAQTVQEADSGDNQARRLLAKEAAAAASTPKG